MGMLGTNQKSTNSRYDESIDAQEKVEREVSVETARKILADDFADELIDQETANQQALELAEQMGIIFIDEIDKVVLTIKIAVKMCQDKAYNEIFFLYLKVAIQTKYGTVNTEHMLFIGAGAFHVSKPSDLIPELQGRFPIRVELESLSVEDFVRILTEPKLSLVKQYEALLKLKKLVNFRRCHSTIS